MSYDGSIVIDTKIDTSSMKSSISTLEKSLKSSVKELSKISDVLKLIEINTRGIKSAIEQNVDSPFSKAVQSVKSFTDTFSSISAAISTLVEFGNAWTNVSQAVDTAGMTQKSMTDSFISGLTTVQGLLSLFSGKLGEATAATNLLSVAQKALKVIAPFSKSATVISGVISVLELLHNATDYETIKAQKLKETNEALEKSYGDIGAAAVKYQEGIYTADNVLDNFNTSLIVSTEKQQDLALQMSNVQNQITEIARTATEERRGLTQSEIQRLDELLTKMNSLTEQEIAIQSSYQQAIQTQAEAAATTQSMTLEQYQVYSQSLIKSADDTKNQLIAKAEEQCTEEIAIANSLRGKKAEYDEAWYNAQVEAAMTKRQQLTDQANLENAETLNIIQKGYVEKSSSLKEYVNKVNDLNDLAAKEKENYEKEIARIDKKYRAIFEDENSDKVQATINYNTEMGNLQQGYQSFTEENQRQITEAIKNGNSDQIGAWLEMVAQTELHGGELDQETKTAVDTLIKNFDSLPQESKDTMSNVLTPMLKTMEQEEPVLFAKASSIANGIITRLKKSFDINSPSRVTKDIFKNVMLGAEKGLDGEKKSLYKKTDSIANGVIDTAKNSFGIHSPSTVMRDEVGKYLVYGIRDGISKNSDEAVKEFDNLLKKLKSQRELDIINEDAYYTKLEKLRDAYFKEGSDEWIEYTTEIYKYQQEMLEQQKENQQKMLQQQKDAIGFLIVCKYM